MEDRTEHGAVAVFVALLSVVLMSAAALGVDLGQAYVAKREVQNQADLAALAGATTSPRRPRAPPAAPRTRIRTPGSRPTRRTRQSSTRRRT
jgi:uncharacterized membrane protein